MTATAPSTPIALAIADGFPPEGRPGSVRVTVTLTPGAGTSDADLSNWPRLTRSLAAGLKLLVREPGTAGGELGPEIATALLVPPVGMQRAPRQEATTDSIVELWNRVMAPLHEGQAKPWNVFRDVLRTSGLEPAVHTGSMLATPAPVAAVALTTGRARSLLDHLSAHGIVTAFGAGGTTAGSTHRVRFASLEATASGLKSGRRRDGDTLATSAVNIARAALGHGGGLGAVMATIRDAHEACTPAPGQLGGVRREKAEATATRRIAAILSSPVLQRLFGWAVDLHADLSPTIIDGLSPEGRFVLLAVEGAGGPPSWTLAKLRPAFPGRSGHFGPASWAEQGAGSSSYEGLEVLNATGTSGPRYELCTVDPELALEAAVGVERQRANGRLRDDQHHTLRSGGLRLVDRDVLSTLVASKPAGSKPADASPKTPIGATTAPPSGTANPSLDPPVVAQVLDADALKPRLRLDLGLDTASGTRWRCAMHRIVRYADPAPGLARPDWIETELQRTLGPPNGSRRIGLEAGTVTTTVLSVEAVTEPSRYPDDKDLDALKNRDATAPKDSAQADLASKQTVLIAESTLASWGGEPMGSATEHHVQTVELELDIDRTVSLPSRTTGDPAWALAMPMRFGWPYRVGLRKVYPGGVCVPLEVAVDAYRDPSTGTCLPTARDAGDRIQDGRRLLRHERVEAPLLAQLASDRKAPRGRMKPQAAAAAVIRTDANPARAVPRVARRILSAPGVGLQFATLHDAFRDWRPEGLAKTPPGGALDGPLHSESTAEGDNTAVVEVARRPRLDQERHYPDPAASTMVLALRRHRVRDGWVTPAIVIPLGNLWSEKTPVLVEVHPARHPDEPRLVSEGLAWLGVGERRFGSEREARAIGRCMAVQAVRVALLPGEDLDLDAWCAPTIDQLVSWFDIVETAGVLAAHDGEGPGADASESCLARLKPLLGAPDEAKTPAPARACTGTGGLPAPSPSALRSLAALIHQSLLRRPTLTMAGLQTIQVTHAVARPQLKPVLFDSNPGRLTVTRRLFPGGNFRAPGHDGETRQDFVGSVPATEWSADTSEEGATSPLFGGRLDIEPASTSGIEIRIECANPHSDLLDDAKARTRPKQLRDRGEWRPDDTEHRFRDLFGFAVDEDRRVSFARETVSPLRIDGLPVPADGRPGVGRFSLEELQAASWGGAVANVADTIPPNVPDGQARDSAPGPGALRATLSTVIGTTGARCISVHPVAIARHANLMEETGRGQGATLSSKDAVQGDAREIWLPATRRPAPPVVHDVQVRLKRWTYGSRTDARTFTVGVHQTTSVRVRIERPWFSSGEGERLGVVLWPPDLFARGVGRDDAGRCLPAEMSDADLGPGGRYVTRWAADSADAVGANLSQLVPGDAFGVPEEGPDSRIAKAFMPLPTLRPTSDASDVERGQDPAGCVRPPDDPGRGTVAKKAPASPSIPEFMAVGLLTAEPRFDVENELWFVDLDVKARIASDPYVRLGLVRYQPHAREDAAPTEGAEPVRLRVSTAVTAPARILPERRSEATCYARSDGGTDIYVTTHVSRPSGDARDGGAGPSVRCTISARSTAPGSRCGQQVVALGADDHLCRWESWSGRDHGAVVEQDGGSIWTCRFVLPGPVETPQWTHSATIEVFSRRPPSEYEIEPVSVDDATDLVESGPDFLAVLELRQSTSREPDGATQVIEAVAACRIVPEAIPEERQGAVGGGRP